MKYLKKIFESLTDDEYFRLREECEAYLAYLLDEDFEVDTSEWMKLNQRISQLKLFDIDIRKIKSATKDQFLWGDVKDHFIPLIELFKSGHFKYSLKEVVFYYKNGDRREFLPYQIKEEGFFDRLEDTKKLICLTLRIEI